MFEAQGFWGDRHQSAFFDVRVFNPLAPSNCRSSLTSTYRQHEGHQKTCIWTTCSLKLWWNGLFYTTVFSPQQVAWLLQATIMYKICLPPYCFQKIWSPNTLTAIEAPHCTFSSRARWKLYWVLSCKICRHVSVFLKWGMTLVKFWHLVHRLWRLKQTLVHQKMADSDALSGPRILVHEHLNHSTILYCWW